MRRHSLSALPVKCSHFRCAMIPLSTTRLQQVTWFHFDNTVKTRSLQTKRCILICLTSFTVHFELSLQRRCKFMYIGSIINVAMESHDETSLHNSCTRSACPKFSLLFHASSVLCLFQKLPASTTRHDWRMVQCVNVSGFSKNTTQQGPNKQSKRGNVTCH